MKSNPIPGRRYHYRCKQCDTRCTLHRTLSQYERIPACRICGNRTYRRMKDRRTVTCYCDGYWFPHRQGSIDCYHNPDYEADHSM